MQPTAEQVRALKDEDFRLTLGQGHQVHPAGELADELYVTAAVLNSTCDGWSSCGRVCSY
ncbi:hypothetical protein ACIG0C_10360 [Kitasatospora aureofaciens]|uniref:Uncharacterized protein n=1 Tax=Kitasatospora aureofaciens TaxID=1894 RepID=A0A1E7MXM2_KITAU|nr:hypothetical protein [Kitasatospora aureofaciens]QEV02619.1 hypothetical protein CP971_28325 [Streptomyces viridifaciens]ARF81399.1 hypothetical protein B6264_23020 [Kitasatospora aureofaciens]OEV32983.1 hypothetical protein HS99_0013990 [Kitasatospora aureofaciens]UKZ09193.1 hypothetical protein BOQ63_035265 [Streptomyces viridifaciens]GGU55061.1 hypothetical protein GCM10010502_01510 [Kitasatospora aureofaciens]